MNRIIYTILLCIVGIAAKSQGMPERYGTALNKVILYSDTSFTVHSNIYYEEGELFEVIGESYYEHEDDAQNQKFKWYKVKTQSGKTGWIFGDGIAIVVEDGKLPAILKPFHKSYANFKSGFEESFVWIAAIDGRDNLYEEEFLNPLYNEYYLVITNSKKKSVHINISGFSADGKMDTEFLSFQDLTKDSIPEIILQTSAITTGSSVKNKNLLIYSFQAGSLVKVFEEYLSLTFDDDFPAPSLYKYVNIHQNDIRIAYVNYVKCPQYELPYLWNNAGQSTSERCIEYITYTFCWNENLKVYKYLYKKTASAPNVEVNKAKVILRDTPSYLGKTVERIEQTTRLKVIKHFEKVIAPGGRKKIVPYLYVLTPSGNYGYLPARQLHFIGIEHASLLNQYYQNPPLSKTFWDSKDSFIKI